mgnify:CR=1 FL=1
MNADYPIRNTILTFLLFSLSFTQTINVQGKILTQNNEPISDVNIYTRDIGTTSQPDGSFSLIVDANATVTFSHIGYNDVLIRANSKNFIIVLKQEALSGNSIQISASRAIEGITPIAFSTLTKEEIKKHYTFEDAPMILASEPGVYAYSESGNGTGYSYISIRGFDQSKISVMIDNVPLNDNESHQVYWVDHGDILSNAKDVQIQRGVGNSLYGSAAFGGSINVITEIVNDDRSINTSIGYGSFNTQKYRFNYNSGRELYKNIGFNVRLSQIKSNGYRDFHNSHQISGFIGIERQTEKMTNQFRAQIGYENTDLTWDGISAENINNRELRKMGYESYTDDFLQQIYSLNTSYLYNENLNFRNVIYLVNGEGYFEVFKENEKIYDYNLDITNQYSDLEEETKTTDLLRRKWIVNNYYGIAPTLSWKNNSIRFDIGSELRFYKGEHYGEVSNFSDENLISHFDKNWYKYYQYTGTKMSFTGFVHMLYSAFDNLKIVADLQYQGHRWELKQNIIGHARGHTLSAPWNFINPKFGIIYNISRNYSMFANYGKSQKEPADSQIIEADDNWDASPIIAAAEVVDNTEFGYSFINEKINGNLNIYKMNYYNEQLKNIDIEQEGEYEYSSVNKTTHEGIEFDFTYKYNSKLKVNLNGALNYNKYASGESKGNFLPNTPLSLGNSTISYKSSEQFSTFINIRYVGKQFIDANNTREGQIDSFALLNIGSMIKFNNLNINLKINNLFDTLYSTFGYSYEYNGYWAYYWPGATRSYNINLEYQF